MRGRLVIAGALACVLGVALYLATKSSKSETPTEETHAPEYEASAIEQVHARIEEARDAAESARASAAKAKRDAMREAIYRAWGMTPPNESTHPSTWPQPPPSASEGFTTDYVRQRIRDDYYPLAKDCYERGLKKNPQLAGKLVTSFRIVGTKNTGGLVDWVDTSSEDNTLDDRDVLECLKQSMYTVTFDAPPHDGVVTVTYPIVFSPDEPDD